MAQADFEEIVETFEFLDDWEDRYAHVIELGKAMDPLPEDQRNALTKVDGCASQVWLVPETGEVLRFNGDSDAMIVRGLIAILRTLYNDRTPADILSVDAPAEFARLGLDKHLSAQRSNGLRAMIARVRDVATHAQTA
ncbi:SufE family protein [Pontivivens insulae]|uniref:Cysteine desulfuration protein SufE n=1 Tax=Pontivivens insulae TaxID=1639689 RepID=A0A2R8ABE6_9RHOB|nr:SufE family protein [Pontivivens insulae]RED11294.1 cysteine desulfuration protein SufE [Pontivivens insulae]SPF29533.1 Cysteine desulfuration protein SufE [Pontivivens insulae]